MRHFRGGDGRHNGRGGGSEVRPGGWGTRRQRAQARPGRRRRLSRGVITDAARRRAESRATRQSVVCPSTSQTSHAYLPDWTYVHAERDAHGWLHPARAPMQLRYTLYHQARSLLTVQLLHTIRYAESFFYF